MTNDLPGFDRVVALDTEFVPVVGGHLVPVCLVAHELISGRRVRLWEDELGPEPPFPTDDRTLHVAFVASAEIEFYLTRGWPAPQRVLDLAPEYYNLINLAVPKHAILPEGVEREGKGLLDALRHFKIPGISVAEKDYWHERILQGFPFTERERHAVLDYCESDVLALKPLMQALLIGVRSVKRAPMAPRRGLVQALNRGGYMWPVAQMQYNGLPIDVPTFKRVKERRLKVMAYLIEQNDREYGVFEGTTLKDGLLRRYLARQGLLDGWPRTDKTGKLSTDKDDVKAQARRHPQLENLRQLLLLPSTLKDFKLAVGPDGRNRTSLWAFGTATGRNAPSNSESVFGPSSWLRSLVKPAAGYALGYVDWSAQEIAIAAALSGDPELLKAVESGDPYLGFAYRAGLVPSNATKVTHEPERGICKIGLLGMNYGMQPRSLAAGTGLDPIQAQSLHRQLKRTFSRFQEWQQTVVDTALLRREIFTKFGWRAGVVEGAKTTTLMNFPAQAHGAEMLRLACNLIVRSGVKLCFPVHDAVVIEAPVSEIDAAVATTRACMGRASRMVLDGFEVATDAEIVRFPERYVAKRGGAMWRQVMEILET